MTELMHTIIDSIHPYYKGVVRSYRASNECFIFMDGEVSKYCFDENPLEFLRRVNDSYNVETKFSSIKWKLVSKGIETEVKILTKKNTVIGCEIINPVVLKPWMAIVTDKEIDDYIRDPKQTINRLYDELFHECKKQLKAKFYYAIHLPKREVKFISAFYEKNSVYEIFLADSQKLLKKWRSQLVCPDSFSVANFFRSNLKKPHWRSEDDARIFCQRTKTHLEYPVPTELASGLTVCNGFIEISGGRHRIANAIFSGAPFVPVLISPGDLSLYNEDLQWG